MTQNYDERFQERVDELLFLENKVEEHIKNLVNMNEHYRKVYEAVTKDISQKMIGVNESFKKINEASEKIADYMENCEKHANRTRKVFMTTLGSCVLAIALTLWWSHHVKANLADAEKEVSYLSGLLKQVPVLTKVDGKPYVRIVPGTEIDDLQEQDGSPIEGLYAEEWHKK